MKCFLFSLLLLSLCVAVTATASTYSSSVVNINATIPDGDLNGYQNSQTVNGIGGSITHVSITLDISGGFNGDLYAYLNHNNTSAILLNRAGRGSASGVGYPDAGFGPDAALNSFDFDDQAGHDVHFYRTFSFALNGNGQLTGQWQPDGRALDPLSASSAFNGAIRSNPLSVFNGMDPNGLWTLYVADVSPGAESTLAGWGMAIEVPEPAGAALMGCGLVAGLLWGLARQRVGMRSVR